MWLANFGWDAIYAAMGPEFRPWARQCHDAYRQGDFLLHCPLAMPMDWGLPELRLGLTAGSPRLDATKLADQLKLPAVTAALKVKLADVRNALAGKPLHTCN